MAPILSEWGVDYEVAADGSCRVKSGQDRLKARETYERGVWPYIFFGTTGKGGPRKKHYFHRVKDKSRALGTFWEAEEVLDNLEWQDVPALTNISLRHELSDHNDAAKKLMKAVLGDECPFDTPKPLKLTQRLIEMFCPKDGVVLDAFAGSGTTGHAVLSLNALGADRRFVLIERGTDADGYAETITAERIRRVIDGRWARPHKDATPTGGEFAYYRAGNPISKALILESKRDDLVDIILTSHEGSMDLEANAHAEYVVGKTSAGNAIALVWNAAKGVDHNVLTMEVYKAVVAEAKALGMSATKHCPVYIYGASNCGPNGSPNYTFHQIPDEILAALGITNLTD
jgi:adenine-specific DNA-methyltransferase